MSAYALCINDDDLCATCDYLVYYPDEDSYCTRPHIHGEWPGIFDLSGCVVQCNRYKHCEPGQNWAMEVRENATKY